MLDVHPPHSTTHTWKDFFIHIATIVVGLLIAVGLDQIVEHIHQRYELRELRESLDREREANRRDIKNDLHDWRWEMAELENELLVLRYLQQHPHSSQDELPGVLLFIQSPVLAEVSVWDAAESSGTVRLMPFEEANRRANEYIFLKGLGMQGAAEYHAFNDAGRFAVGDGDPTHLTAAQLDRMIELMQIAMEAHIEVGNSLAYLHLQRPDLGSDLTYEEVGRAEHHPVRDTPEQVVHARQLTAERLTAAGLSARGIQAY